MEDQDGAVHPLEGRVVHVGPQEGVVQVGADVRHPHEGLHGEDLLVQEGGDGELWGGGERGR